MSKLVKKAKKVGDKIFDATHPKFMRKLKGSLDKAAEKLKKNKYVRMVAIAVAIYFTAGAALGAMGAASAGTSILGGAQAGLASAWGGVTGAGSALMSGNLAGAGSSLWGGVANAYGAGAGTLAAGAAPAAATGEVVANTAVAQSAPVSMPAAAQTTALPPVGAEGAIAAAPTTAGEVVANNAVAQSAPVSAPGPAQVSALPPAGGSQGLVGQAIDFMKTPGGGLLTSAGLKLAGGMLSDKSMQDAQAEELARANRNQNVSNMNLRWTPTAQQTGQRPMVAVPEFDPRKYQQGLVASQFAPG